MEYTKINEERRAVNFFDTSVTITKEDLKKIYEKAKLAPTSFNLQPYKIMVALSKEMKKTLLPAAFNQPKIVEASAVLAICGNKKAFSEWDDVIEDMLAKGYLTKEKEKSTREMASFLYTGQENEFVSRNAGIFAMNFMLSAKNEGWDTHPMDGMNRDEVRKVFNLSNDYLPVMLIAIGKKSKEKNLLPKAMRRDFEKVFEIF